LAILDALRSTLPFGRWIMDQGEKKMQSSSSDSVRVSSRYSL
jgi:hypothetical protein